MRFLFRGFFVVLCYRPDWRINVKLQNSMTKLRNLLRCYAIGMSIKSISSAFHLCKNGIRTLYSNTSKLLSSLKVAKAKNTIETELKKIERCQLLILDDAFLVPLDAKERPILLEIIEDRHDRKSIVMASQLPVENWYDAIGDQAVADAVLDRIVHSSHRIELFGESIRKMKAKK